MSIIGNTTKTAKIQRNALILAEIYLESNNVL